jgi:hypothetical protein
MDAGLGRGGMDAGLGRGGIEAGFGRGALPVPDRWPEAGLMPKGLLPPLRAGGRAPLGRGWFPPGAAGRPPGAAGRLPADGAGRDGTAPGPGLGPPGNTSSLGGCRRTVSRC